MRKIVSASMIVLVAVALAAFAAEIPEPLPRTEEVEAASVDMTIAANLAAPVENACVEAAPRSEALDVAGFEVTAMAGGGCKSCKGRPWCGCTYQGKPRVSCNPCCYQGAWDPYPVCFD